jgi:hypothetical protein
MARNYDYNGDPCGEFGTALREVNKLQDEIERLRLTDAEREAIALAKSRLGTSDGDWQADDVLAALLERLG